MPCHDLTVPAPALEEAVFATIRQQLEVVLSNVQNTLSTADLAIAEKSAYEAQVEAVTDEKQHLFESYLSGEIDAATFQAEKVLCDGKLQKVKNAYVVLTAQAKENKESQAKQSLAQQAIQEIRDENILSPSIVDRLIEKVNVFPGNRIEIEYKVQDLFDF